MFHSMLVAKWANSVSTGDSVMFGYAETYHVETNDKFKLVSIVFSKVLRLIPAQTFLCSLHGLYLLWHFF